MDQINKLPSKVAVLMGGVGSEREVSLQSGANIALQLQSAGLQVVAADVNPDNLSVLDDESVDVFFLALHGEWGEDGQIQKILENKNLIFTGSGSKASSISFDKVKSKNKFANANVPVAFSIELFNQKDVDSAFEKLSENGEKFVVKPSCQGSSVGVEITTGIEQTLNVARTAVEKFGPTMIEKFIDGKELTVGIVAGKAMPVIEICSNNGFYDFNAKYISENTEYLFDTIEDSNLVERIKSDAVKCFNAVNAKDLARVDFMLDSNGNHYALEINTLPGFTSHSLLPKAALKAGMTQPKLCLEIIRSAMN